MQRSVKRLVGLVVLLGAMVSFSQLVFNSFYLRLMSNWAMAWSSSSAVVAEDRLESLILAARHRALLYESFIEKKHLVDGLVVNRGMYDHQAIDECDSLLFSSLRWVSLKKFGWSERAHRSLQYLRRAQVEGGWVRHPLCAGRPLSRDMLMGILMVLSQGSRGFEQDLSRLISRIREGGGYFSSGPAYVSYLTPGLGKIIRMLLIRSGLELSDMPIAVRNGYSTNEWSLLLLRPGYEAHLAALGLWLEMEIGESSDGPQNVGALSKFMASAVSALSGEDPLMQAHQWVALRLVQIDPKNLFFRYLWFRSVGVLTSQVAAHLLAELLQMTQFPPDRLPNSCDRSADYIWQRGSHEYVDIDHSCDRQFSGTDFLWMASLLVEVVESSKEVYLPGAAH